MDGSGASLRAPVSEASSRGQFCSLLCKAGTDAPGRARWLGKTGVRTPTPPCRSCVPSEESLNLSEPPVSPLHKETEESQGPGKVPFYYLYPLPSTHPSVLHSELRGHGACQTWHLPPGARGPAGETVHVLTQEIMDKKDN